MNTLLPEGPAEYRAEKAAAALHSQISHQVVGRRDGRFASVDVTALVPGDVVELGLGEVVPADVRLTAVTRLECDESVLTGESQPVEKTTVTVSEGAALADVAIRTVTETWAIGSVGGSRLGTTWMIGADSGLSESGR